MVLESCELLDESWTCGLSLSVLYWEGGESQAPNQQHELLLCQNLAESPALVRQIDGDTFRTSLAEAKRTELMTAHVDSTITVNSELHEHVN